MTPAPPEWVAKTVASFAAIPGWLWMVLALSGTIIRYAPVPDFVHFQRDQGWWLLSATVFCWLVVLVKLGQAMWQLIRNTQKKRSRKRAVLDHLHSLSPDEKAVIFGCLARRERTYIASIERPNDLAAVQALMSKGLLLPSSKGVGSLVAIPYTIPAFVWNALCSVPDSNKLHSQDGI